MTAHALLFCFAALMIPAVALGLAAPHERAVEGLAVAPFGWPSLLMVHLAAALPLGIALASHFAAGWAGWSPTHRAIAVVLLGLLLATAGYLAAQPLGEAVLPGGFLLAGLMRTGLCVLLVWPWCLAIPSDKPAGRLFLGIALAAALLLPMIQAERLAERQTRQAMELLRQDQLVRARPIWVGVCDLTPGRLIAGFKKPLTPGEILQTLDQDLARLTRQVAHDLPASASHREKWQQVTALLSLDRAREAERLLRTLPQEPGVLLQLANALERQNRPTESDAVIRPLLSRPEVLLRRKVYEMLLRSAGDRRDTAEVERLLHQAIADIPSDSGELHFHLGLHYQQTGRPILAMAAFKDAVKVDPGLHSHVEPRLLLLAEHTPACLLR